MELRFALPFALVLFTACQRDQWDDCITSTGPMSSVERSLAPFDRIVLEDRIDLVLEQRAAATVAVTGGGNLLDQVETEVVDGELRIRSRLRCNWVRSFKPRITVHAPIDGVCHLTLRGTGKASCSDTVRCAYFLLEERGGEGGADLLLSTVRSDIALHTGAGAVVVRGRTQRAELFSGIMAPLDASGLQASDCAVRNSGVADIRCWALHRLDVAIEDVGDVYYRGDPHDVHSEVIGTGRLYRME